MKTHKVKKGDTLWSIAKLYLGDGNKYRQIMALNGMTDTVIQVGEVLRIPTKASYEEIGKAFEAAMNDVDNLKSVQNLYDLIGD